MLRFLCKLKIFCVVEVYMGMEWAYFVNCVTCDAYCVFLCDINSSFNNYVFTVSQFPYMYMSTCLYTCMYICVHAVPYMFMCTHVCIYVSCVLLHFICILMPLWLLSLYVCLYMCSALHIYVSSVFIMHSICVLYCHICNIWFCLHGQGCKWDYVCNTTLNTLGIGLFVSHSYCSWTSDFLNFLAYF